MIAGLFSFLFYDSLRCFVCLINHFPHGLLPKILHVRFCLIWHVFETPRLVLLSRLGLGLQSAPTALSESPCLSLFSMSVNHSVCPLITSFPRLSLVFLSFPRFFPRLSSFQNCLFRKKSRNSLIHVNEAEFEIWHLSEFDFVSQLSFKWTSRRSRKCWGPTLPQGLSEWRRGISNTH